MPTTEAGGYRRRQTDWPPRRSFGADQTHVAGRGVAVIAWSVGSDLVGARIIDLGCTGVAPDLAIFGRVGEPRTELSANEPVVC